MKNSLFRQCDSASEHRETMGRPSWKVNRNGQFLSEGDFASALSLERKRVERSHKLLLLLLLDASKILGECESERTVSKIHSVLTYSTRETDVKGWYREGSTIGVIFTEISESEKRLVENAVVSRATNLLQSRLKTDRVQQVAMSLKFFPESGDWMPRGGDGNGGLYPDPAERDGSKKADRILKRTIDVAGSTLALVVLAPLIGLITLLIKFTSNGPVLFKQERVGQRGRRFGCFKFRSMYVASDSKIHQEYIRDLISAGARNSKSDAGEAGGVYKIKNDPRVTPMGRFLRKTSLDELPQFWNVLKGEMSLVGPRPAIPYEIEFYDLWHRRRVLDVKPGITGLWQVCGRSRTTFDEMVRLDLRYARSWSIWLDLEILLKTPKAVFSGEGAY